MAIVWIILVDVLCVQLVSGVCQPAGKSGPGCVYDCHCNNATKCDESSDCQGQCTIGWRGRTCQRGNFALRKTTNSSPPQSTKQGSGKAVDGALGDRTWSQFHTNPNTSLAWWSVDLGTQESVQEVIIYFRTDNKFRRHGLQLYYSTSEPNSAIPDTWGTLCYNVSGLPVGSDIPDDLPITQCSGQWRYLFIYTDTKNDPAGPILDFAEVEVYGCSKGAYGNDCSLFCDGCDNPGCDTSGQCKAGCKPGRAPPLMCNQNCPEGYYGTNCTGRCDQRGCSELSAQCDSVYGYCPGGCTSNFINGDCSVCAVGWYGYNCDKQCASRKCCPSNVTAPCGRDTGNCSDGCKTGYQGSDCYEECPLGVYGAGCSGNCSSRQCFEPPDTCDHVTGNCPSGCAPGNMGTDCTQNCSSGSYGVNCMNICSDRNCMDETSACDSVNGQCPGSCQIGFSGPDCSIACPAGTYGSECLNCSSRHCRGDQTCPSDGSCSQGCESGWTLNTCTLACPSGFYGRGCNSSCGKCKNNEICDHITGKCPQECPPGKISDLCKSPCTRGMYGDNCKLTCGHCNGTCDPVTGQCPGGCTDGYIGDTCMDQLPQIGAGPPYYVPAVAGVIPDSWSSQ